MMEINENNYENISKKYNNLKKIFSFFINNNQNNKESFHHKNNQINTTKYNFITFLPKSLLFQFLRLANCYFLFIAIIQCIPIISPLSPITAIAPLACVLIISIIREGIEDYARYKYDKLQNKEMIMVFREEKFQEATSESLQIGEIVLIKENQSFPADIVLLDSNLTDGIAYIETATLDGEKSLKLKISRKEVSGFFKNGSNWKDQFHADGKFNCEPPNSNLYELNGNLYMTLKDESVKDFRKIEISINEKQLLLKGAILKNTRWIIGFLVYTGKNTKLILNSQKQRIKFSRVETLMSKLLIFILILQFLLCAYCSIMHFRWHSEVEEIHDYLHSYYNHNPIVDALIDYLTYALLLNTMIPISLIITLEIVKIIQGIFTRFDVELYSHIRKRFAKAGSISLNEELGQVNYIFTDKTGTLTCNKMDFRYCVIGDVCYEYKRDHEDNYSNKALNIYNSNNSNNNSYKQLENNKNETEKIREEMKIQIFGPNYMKGFLKQNSIAIDRTKYKNYSIYSEINHELSFNMQDESVLINEFWKVLSMNHDCLCNNESEDKIEYTSVSPDDIELVKTAAEQGYRLLKSDSNYVRKIRIGNEIHEFRILKILEFNSERKRMSIIIRDGEFIKLYIKGADSIIKQKLSKFSRADFLENCTNYVDYFSGRGLRTLFVGMKILDQEYFSNWISRLNKAELSDSYHDSVENLYDEIESDIHLIGATVVEDKLQDKVPETIKDMRIAGIKIWMLTGDKMDTACNIGLSCNLISNSEKIFKISGEDGDKFEDFLENYMNFQNEINITTNYINQSYSIMLDSVALAHIFSDKLFTKTFLAIAKGSISVICCRVTPKQKSDVVKNIKSFIKDAVTLAIGDGGNDVAMITEAHIGIGVYGEEGMRAVQASDYAIGEFKLLRRLLMFHGRTNNIRISEMILYFFYKNFIFTIIHFFYGFYNKFSGQTIFDDWFISLYNVFFTAVPLIVRALSDFDVRPDDGEIVNKMLPILYKENRENPVFTKKNFLLSLLRGIIYATFAFGITQSLRESAIDKDGNIADLWYLSANIYTVIIFIISARLMIVQKYMTWVSPVVMLFLSWFAYLTFIFIVEFDVNFKSHASILITLSSGKFYLNFYLSLIITIVSDLAIYCYQVNFSETIHGALLINVKEKGKIDKIEELSEQAKKFYDIYFSEDDKKEYVQAELIIINRLKSKEMPKISSKQNALYIAHETLGQKRYSQSNKNIKFNIDRDVLNIPELLKNQNKRLSGLALLENRSRMMEDSKNSKFQGIKSEYSSSVSLLKQNSIMELISLKKPNIKQKGSDSLRKSKEVKIR